MTKLSIIDAGFLLIESPSNPKHVACLQIFRLPKGKGPAWLRHLLSDLKQSSPGFPFNQRVVMKNPLKPKLVQDDDIDMDYHLRHTVLPRPGNDDQLWEMTARLHANVLDRDQPLWEFHLIEGLTDRRFAFYTKIHHALADGVTMNRWFAEAGSLSPDEPDSHPIWQTERTRQAVEKNEPSYLQLMLEGLKLLGGGVQTTMDLTILSAKLIQHRFFEGHKEVTLPLSAPHTPLNVSPGAARCLAATTFQLDLIKSIARSQKASVNDVLLTICDLSVSRYLTEHGNETKEPLVVYMPVNLRSDDEGDGGNMVSLLQVRMASNHEDSLVALQQIKTSSRTAREVFSGYGKPAIQVYSLAIALLAQAEESLKLDRLLPPTNNLIVSNVPGPKQKLYFRGAESLSAYPISTLAPLTSLNVTANSYGGTIHVCLVSGRSAIPDLSKLAQYMKQEIENLALATGVV